MEKTNSRLAEESTTDKARIKWCVLTNITEHAFDCYHQSECGYGPAGGEVQGATEGGGGGAGAGEDPQEEGEEEVPAKRAREGQEEGLNKGGRWWIV